MENIKKVSTSIKSWAEDDRPREKMLKKGVDALSNSELLGILIGQGSKEKSAVALAKDILQLGHDNLHELGRFSVKDLQKLKGIGAAKAIGIIAALELGRRRQSSDILPKRMGRTSKEIADYLKVVLKDYNYEVFAVVFMNRANKIKSFQVISTGGLTGTVADPRMILKKALEEEATSIILSHNHPSGNLKPSRADEDVTFKIKHAASYLDIQVLDHIIVSEEGYFSFADEGML
jgi:DNA repair protein RadC